MSKFTYSLAGWTCTIGEFAAGFVAVTMLAFGLFRGDAASVLVGAVAAGATYGFHRINEAKGW